MRPPQEIVEWPQWKSGVLLREAYEPRKLGGWRARAQDFAIWILRKLKCQANVYADHWAQRRVVPGDLGELMCRQIDSLIDMLTKYDGEIVVVVGYEDWRRLMDWGHRDFVHEPMSVDASVRIGRNLGAVDRYTREPVPTYKVYGFRVVMIPWVTGVHVLPKDYLLGHA